MSSSRTEPGYVSPVQVARALGVSQSTVKRWVDENRLPAHVTVGGHRRILVRDVLDLVSRKNLPRLDLTALGVEGVSIPPDVTALRRQLHQTLRHGNAEQTREVILGAYQGGLTIPALADDVIVPVMAEVGDDWSSGQLDVYQEHFGTQQVLSALMALQARVEAVEFVARDAPLALGGGPEGDHYVLANLLIGMMLRQLGWQVVHIGPNTPFESFRKAICHLKPRLLWLSCSYIPDRQSFLTGYASLYCQAEAAGVAVAVGGRALTEELRCAMTFTHHGDRLTHLAAYARQLYRPTPRADDEQDQAQRD